MAPEIIDDNEDLPASNEEETKSEQNGDIFDETLLISNTKISFEEVNNCNEADTKNLSTSDTIEQMHVDEKLSILNSHLSVESAKDYKEKDTEKGLSVNTLEKDTSAKEMPKETKELNFEADGNNNTIQIEEKKSNLSTSERDKFIKTTETIVETDQEFLNSQTINVLNPFATNEMNDTQPNENFTENQPQAIVDVTSDNTSTEDPILMSNVDKVEKSENIFFKMICCFCCCLGHWPLSK